MKKLLLISLCCLFYSIQIFAQDRTVTGMVIAKEDGGPMPGVGVRVKGSNLGVVTSVDGRYSITVPASATTLEFSFIGYATQDVAITASPLNVTLVISNRTLGEVVVTGALGIQRTRNQQSYAAQQIGGDEVGKQRSDNFVDGLSGKVSGLQITQSNSLGASTNAVIRGYKSLINNNQALFVIDGTPIDNTITNTATAAASGGYYSQATGSGGYDYGSPVSDLNPDDIESVTVLKGAGATALYGSRGSNGVILVTTKKAKKGLGIIINSTISVGSIDKSTFPKYQSDYGAGYGQYYNDPSGYFFYFDANGDGTPDLVTPTTEDASYGARFNSNLQVYQWDAFVKGLPNYGKATPWVAEAKGPATFFITPISTEQSIGITNGGDNGTFKLNYTKSVNNGVLPNSQLDKNLFDFGATYNITPQLTAGAALNFANVNGKGRGATGYDGANSDARNVMTNFREWWEVNTDVQELKQAYQLANQNVTWNMADPQNGVYGPIFWNNPYYVTNHNYETDTRNRYIGNVNLNYKPTSWLNLMVKGSLDTYSSLNEERYDVSSIGVPYYNRSNRNFSETNFDFLANFDKDVSSQLNVKALVGANVRRDNTNTIVAGTNGGLIVPGIYALSNSVAAPLAPLEGQSTKEVDGVFAGATLTWNKLITVDGTIRRDVSSTLPAGNNIYYYPSVSAGFIFSELLKNSSWLSYGKIRANHAQVGSDAPLYSVLDTYNISSPYGSLPQTALSSTKNNPNLRPENNKSDEIGIEIDLFKNRLHFDGSYYHTLTFDEILPVTISSATGYAREYLNAGSVRNNGIELSLGGVPLQTKSFKWNINLTFTENRNLVTSLFTDGSGNQSSNLLLASFQNGESLNAPLNEPFGMIRGTDYTYDANGNKIVGTNGQYINTATANHDIGNTNPDWLGGINNTFTFKDLTLSFLIDIRKGGSIFSTDMAYGLATGLYPETDYINDLGNPVRNSLATGGGFIRPGVVVTGGVSTPNTKRVSASDYSAFGYVRLPDAAFIYDASYVKLREVLLGYSLPKSFVSKLGPVKNVGLQVIGHNLWIIHKNLPYSDPEDNLSAGNFQGIQEGAYPTTRTVSFNLKVSF